MVNEMSSVLKQYNLSIEDYKAISARMTAVQTLLEKHIERYGERPMNKDDLIHGFATIRLALAATANGDYKKFGSGEFVDFLLYCETKEALDFRKNPKQLHEEMAHALEEWKEMLRKRGEPEANINEWASESKFYLSRPNFLQMLQSVLQKPVYEKLKEEKLIGE
ncbi:MAG TPA: hypothetical protein VJJ76_02650 [archaeon]|nr:hypothetical protein [archaeon]